MSSQNADSVVDRYLRMAGQAVEQRCQLTIVEINWLINLSTRLMGLRLELLRALQSALPRSDEQGSITELKEYLTNLIIMQTRLADRDGRINELINQLAEDQILDGASVDEVALREAIVDILQACAHIESLVANA